MRTQVEVQGTLREDGTLELDHKPELPAGRVRVMVQLMTPPAPPKEDLLQFLQRIRAEREASGYPFMTSEEAEAYIEDLRSGDERLEEEERRKEEKGCCSPVTAPSSSPISTRLDP